MLDTIGNYVAYSTKRRVPLERAIKLSKAIIARCYGLRDVFINKYDVLKVKLSITILSCHQALDCSHYSIMIITYNTMLHIEFVLVDRFYAQEFH